MVHENNNEMMCGVLSAPVMGRNTRSGPGRWHSCLVGTRDATRTFVSSSKNLPLYKIWIYKIYPSMVDRPHDEVESIPKNSLAAWQLISYHLLR